MGHWVTDSAAGIRGFAYDENFPDDFSDLGRGRYSRVHAVGEIWCATLMDLSRRIGRNLCLQLVVDALKATPANPSFLDARDAIFAVLEGRRAAELMTETEFVVAMNGAGAVSSSCLRCRAFKARL